MLHFRQVVADHSPGLRITRPPTEPIRLQEHDSTEPFQMSAADYDFIKGLGEETTPLRVEFTHNGQAILKSFQYVGVVTLPSGTTMEISPKETVTKLVWLLQYALNVPSDTIETATELQSAETFIDAFGALFYAELRQLLQQGIRREYRRTQTVSETVRGQLDVERQLQRPEPIPVDFAIEYDQFTKDTVLNQAILAAATELVGLVRDTEIASNLELQRQRLRQQVTPAPVSRNELEAVDLTRLSAYYEDIFTLTKLVLSRRYFDDIRVGERVSYGLLINMNAIFEATVERAFRNAGTKFGLNVEGQATVSDLIEGPHAVAMTPDFAIRTQRGELVLVGDAKWKTNAHEAADIYQLTSYMLADETPGVLVYPSQRGDRVAQSTVRSDFILRSIELPTANPTATYEEYQAALEAAAIACLQDLLPGSIVQVGDE